MRTDEAGVPPAAPAAVGRSPATPPGADGSAAAPLPPPRGNTSLRPALIVLGIAGAVIVLFGVLAIVSNQGPTTTSAPTTPAAVRGTSLRAVGAARALAPIEQPGTPPANILDALSLPQGSSPLGHVDNAGATAQYDQQMQFSIGASEAEVVDFFHTELSGRGWKIQDVGAATNVRGGVEVLAEKAGDDGWYWEAGAIVSPTTFGPSGDATGSTAFTLRLVQVPDED